MSEVILFKENSLMPKSVDEKLALAEVLSKLGLMPNSVKTPQQIFVSIQWGHELGLSPMVAINNISVVNGKPSLGADIMHALARKSPEYAGCEWKSMTAEKAEVIITRKSNTVTESFIGYFDMKLAERAGLTGKDNWKKYPQRMLKHRALSYALRDAFPDVLAGIYTPEEMGDDNVLTDRNITNSADTSSKVLQAETAIVPETSAPVENNDVNHEELRERGKLIIETISDILTYTDSEGAKFFSETEKELEKKFIKDTASTEEGLWTLIEHKNKLEATLKERIQGQSEKGKVVA